MTTSLDSNSAAPATIPNGVSFAELESYPQAACALAAEALKNGQADLARRVFEALKEKMLPSESNPWEGPAGQFWAQAFRLDPTQWLKDSIGKLPKEQAKESARTLLMAAAQNKAFECFDYLLSLGAIKRTWKPLESAYVNGGWRAAEKVKKPTPQEAEKLLERSASRSYRYETVALEPEGIDWLASYLKGSKMKPVWLIGVSSSQGDQISLAALDRAAALGLEQADLESPETLCALALRGATQTALRLLGARPAASVIAADLNDTVYMPGSTASWRESIYIRAQKVSVFEAALLGLSADLCKELIARGDPIPSKQRMESIFAQCKTGGSWVADRIKRLEPEVESMREAIELDAMLRAEPKRKTSAKML